MFKKISFALVAVAFMCVNVMANDDLLSEGSLDLASINSADNTIVEANLDVDVDALTKTQGEKGEDAVEACFRGYGGGYGGYGCYNYCYSPCYYSYSYYCQPTYFCYRPVYHHCYTPVYTMSYWGCY